jgi:PEP-CTERM/exosortase A-associated glycosyltransferase
MTVLHILDHSLPVMSGYSIRSHNIVAFQRDLGLRPVVVTSPKHCAAGPPREELEGIPHYRTGAAVGAGGTLPYAGELIMMLRLARRIREVARAEHAQILHAHSPLLNGLPALLVGRQLGLPVVYESRAFWEDAAVHHRTTREGSLRYRLSRALETLLFKRADRVVVIGEAMRREIIERGVAADRLTVVPNGVDTTRFSPVPRSQALAGRLGLGDHVVLGFIGSFYRYEGLQFLVEALPAIRGELPGARVLLVGGGEEEPALRAAAAAMADGVVFAGQVPYHEVSEYYSVIDIFVCPRHRMRLTELVTPLKPLEAMAMGRSVLASDVGGQAELIRHEVTGLLFPAESRGSLVEAAARLGRDPATRARLGKQAREQMVQERGWRQVVGRYLPVYGSLG